MTTAADIRRAYPKMSSYADEIVATSQRLNIDPAWLANVINFESAGGNPQARNPVGGATGLIQFIKSTAARLGTSTDALYRMTGKQQMVYVERYFQPYKGRMRSQTDVFTAVFFPANLGKGPGAALPAWARAGNAGIQTMGDYARMALARAKLAGTGIPGPRWAPALLAAATLVGALAWRRWGAQLRMSAQVLHAQRQLR